MVEIKMIFDGLSKKGQKRAARLAGLEVLLSWCFKKGSFECHFKQIIELFAYLSGIHRSLRKTRLLPSKFSSSLFSQTFISKYISLYALSRP